MKCKVCKSKLTGRKTSFCSEKCAKRHCNQQQYYKDPVAMIKRSSDYYYEHKDDPGFKEKAYARKKAWYESPEGQEWFKSHRKKYLPKQLKQNKIWRDNNKDKIAAVREVNRLIVSGDIVKTPCIKCGSENSQKKFSDYENLVFTWECRKCYRKPS